MAPGVGDVLAETHLDSTGSLKYTYVYVQNHRGDTIALVTNGVIAAQYDYSAWGEITSHTGADAWFTFSGKHYDADAGLYYYGFRWYDAVAKRWTQPDPSGLSEGLDLYRFCDNDPVNGVDVYGLYSAKINAEIRRIADTPTGKTPIGKKLVTLLDTMNKEGRINYGRWGDSSYSRFSATITLVNPGQSSLPHEGIHALQDVSGLPIHIAAEVEADYYGGLIGQETTLGEWQKQGITTECAYETSLRQFRLLQLSDAINDLTMENNLSDMYLRNLWFNTADQPYEGLMPIKGLFPYTPQVVPRTRPNVQGWM